jgi:hypothetical protein
MFVEMELTKRAEADIVAGILDKYPDEPRPVIVDVIEAVVKGPALLIEETLRAKVLAIWNRPVPATSNVAPGVAVWMPTLLFVFTMKAGVAFGRV